MACEGSVPGGQLDHVVIHISEPAQQVLQAAGSAELLPLGAVGESLLQAAVTDFPVAGEEVEVGGGGWEGGFMADLSGSWTVQL